MPCWSRKRRYVSAGKSPQRSGASDHSAAASGTRRAVVGPRASRRSRARTRSSDAAPTRPAIEIAAAAAQERRHLGEEPPVPRVEEAPPLGEQRRGARAAPLEIGAGERDRERHRRRARRDAGLGQQAEEVRVALAVADDEAHVHRDAARVDSVDAAAGRRGGLDQRDLVRPGEGARGAEPGDPAPTIAIFYAPPAAEPRRGTPARASMPGRRDGHAPATTSPRRGRRRRPPRAAGRDGYAPATTSPQVSPRRGCSRSGSGADRRDVATRGTHARQPYHSPAARR